MAEVAEKEGISTRRLRLLCEEGRVLYCDKVGGQWLIQLNYAINRKPTGRPRKRKIASWHPQSIFIKK